MNILINRSYVVSVFGVIHRVGFFKMVLARCFHAYKDALASKKYLPVSSFRIIGSYVC